MFYNRRLIPWEAGIQNLEGMEDSVCPLPASKYFSTECFIINLTTGWCLLMIIWWLLMANISLTFTLPPAQINCLLINVEFKATILLALSMSLLFNRLLNSLG